MKLGAMSHQEMWEVGQDALGAVTGHIRPGRLTETFAAFYALRADKFVNPETLFDLDTAHARPADVHISVTPPWHT
jgi:hypothetical protein